MTFPSREESHKELGLQSNAFRSNVSTVSAESIVRFDGVVSQLAESEELVVTGVGGHSAKNPVHSHLFERPNALWAGPVTKWRPVSSSSPTKDRSRQTHAVSAVKRWNGGNLSAIRAKWLWTHRGERK